MTDSARESTARIVALREAFDRSFADPPAPPAPDLRDFVGIRVAAEDYAVAREEIAGVVPVTRIVRLPGGPPSLLGVAGLNGDAVMVHGLAALLGRTQEDAAPRWLLLAAADRGRAFAFERLGAYLRILAAHVSALDGGGRGTAVLAAAMADGRRLPVISIGALLESMGNRPGPGER